MLALVVVYAAALRLESLTVQFGAVESPSWARALQQRGAPAAARLHPRRVNWEPAGLSAHRDGPPTRYSSDPYTYLQYARSMRSFYAAHYREPLFPFVTRVFLHLLDDHDQAVSFASALFSILLVAATWLLGRSAFSPWVGLGAAAAMAIEYDVITTDVMGWRDDAFALAVVGWAYALLRQSRAPTRTNALLTGIVGGLACLIRITSLSFIVPGLAYLLFSVRRSWQERAGAVAIAAFATALVAGPYVVNCWRVYGDPLYAINHHTGNYLLSEGRAVDTPPSVAAYVGSKATARPFQTADTIALGLTTYPFTNKWRGFERWHPWLGVVLEWAAPVGLLLFAGSPAGRLLLILLVTSLMPFAVTWKLIGDWRFTEHAYPFFLMASFLAVDAPVRWVLARVAPGRDAAPVFSRRRAAGWCALLLATGAGVWTIERGLPVLVFRESLRADDGATIVAGERDGAFFGRGWSAASSDGSLTVRVSEGRYSEVRLPLPRVADYQVTVRLDPSPRPIEGSTPRLPPVRAFLNGHAVGTLDLQWNPVRFGMYDLQLPRSLVRKRGNRLVLMVDEDFRRTAPPGQEDGFRLWYLRVRPQARSTP